MSGGLTSSLNWSAFTPSNFSLCPVPDFAALPPEINSGRMYSGPGSGSLLAAAAAWDGLAEELQLAATGTGGVISELTTLWWQGPVAESMAAAMLPFVTWLSETALLAGQVATKCKAAAAAYELAFALTVPPQVVAANRTLLMTLISTNWFGQNTPAIATAECHYSEMWVQDAVAMAEYANSAAAASILTPFAPPPETTNPAGLADQAVATAHAAATTAHLVGTTAVVSLLQHHASIAAFPWNTALKYWTEFLNAVATTEAFVYDTGGFTLMDLQVLGVLLSANRTAPTGVAAAAADAAGAAMGSGWLQPGAGPIAAAVGLADKIGPTSVPPDWAVSPTTPGAQTVGISAPSARAAATRAAEMSGLLQGLSPRRAGETGGNFGRRYGSKVRVVCRPPSAG